MPWTTMSVAGSVVYCVQSLDPSVVTDLEGTSREGHVCGEGRELT